MRRFASSAPTGEVRLDQQRQLRPQAHEIDVCLNKSANAVIGGTTPRPKTAADVILLKVARISSPFLYASYGTCRELAARSSKRTPSFIGLGRSRPCRRVTVRGAKGLRRRTRALRSVRELVQQHCFLHPASPLQLPHRSIGMTAKLQALHCFPSGSKD